jgi:hypothetical protein
VRFQVFLKAIPTRNIFDNSYIISIQSMLSTYEFCYWGSSGAEFYKILTTQSLQIPSWELELP